MSIPSLASGFSAQDAQDLYEVREFVDRVKAPSPSLSSAEIQFILDFVMRAPDLKLRRRRLAVFVIAVLKLPADFARRHGRLELNRDGVDLFDSLVRCVKEAVETLLEDVECEAFVEDMYEEDYFLKAPRSHEEIELGLLRSPCLDRVLGPSKLPNLLRWEPLVAALRLFAVLNAVNENWGALFGTLTTGPLVYRSCFAVRPSVNALLFKSVPCLASMASQYLFMLTYGSRATLHEAFKEHFRPPPYVPEPMAVPPGDVVDFAVDNLERLECSRYRWSFRFEGNLRDSVRSQTADFYLRFSDECHSSDLGVWISGHADGSAEAGDGRLSFPAPRSCLSLRAGRILTAVGRIIAKSFVDGQKLLLRMSRAAYKCIFHAGVTGSSQRHQQQGQQQGQQQDQHHQLLTLSDVKDVMPEIQEFVSCLVDSLREKWLLEEDRSLTWEERARAVSGITCGGHRFSELGINFTVPGYQDLEMIPGGRNVCLTPENVEEYLKLLVWCLLHKGPREGLRAMQAAFQGFLPLEAVSMFFPDEINSVLQGLEVASSLEDVSNLDFSNIGDDDDDYNIQDADDDEDECLSRELDRVRF